MNSGDVYEALRGFNKKDWGSAMAVFLPDGRVNILEIPPTASGELFRMSRKKVESLLDVTWEEQGQGVPLYDLMRQKVRDFSAQYGLVYHEGAW